MFQEIIADLNGYIQSRPNYSVEKFASQGKISERTVYRFLKGEAVSERSFLAILQVIYGNSYKQILSTLTKKYPENENLQKVLALYSEKSSKGETGDEFLKQFYIRNPINYQLILLLTSEDGIDKGQLGNELGVKGLKSLEELILHQRVIELPNKNYRLKNSTLDFFDGHTAKSLASLALGLYDPETFGTKDSQIAHVTGWTTEEGLTDIKTILLEAIMKCLKVEKDKPGTIPYSLATCMIKTREDANKSAEGLTKEQLA